MTHPLVVRVGRSKYDVYVGRSPRGEVNDDYPWGNPFSDGSRAENVRRHREWFLSQPGLVRRAVAELRGKRLGCHCAPRDCHAEIIARVANGEVLL